MTFSQAQARAYAGRPRKRGLYFGSPCGRGHEGWRYVTCGSCVECMKQRRQTRIEAPLSAATHMVISDWYRDELGNRCRTVTAE